MKARVSGGRWPGCSESGRMAFSKVAVSGPCGVMHMCRLAPAQHTAAARSLSAQHSFGTEHRMDRLRSSQRKLLLLKAPNGFMSQLQRGTADHGAERSHRRGQARRAASESWVFQPFVLHLCPLHQPCTTDGRQYRLTNKQF